MPLTGKIPKLDTQKLFDEMVVLESEVAGIIDGSLGQLRNADKTDEYWEIYTTRLANMIDDYIVGSELVGNTTAPDTKLAPGVLDTFGGLTTAPGSVDGDTHQGEFEGVFMHLGFIPGFSTKHNKVVETNVMQNPGEYLIKANVIENEDPEPFEMPNPSYNAASASLAQRGKKPKITNLDGDKITYKNLNQYLEDYPKSQSVETEPKPEGVPQMSDITGIHLSSKDSSGKTYDLAKIPGKSKVEIKQGDSKGTYEIESIDDLGTYITFNLKPLDTDGNLIKSGNINLDWESTSGSPAKIQLQKDLFKVYNRPSPQGETPKQSIELFANGFADAIDKYVAAGTVVVISDTPDIKIKGPISNFATGGTGNTGVGAVTKFSALPPTSMGIGKANVVDREDAKEYLIENLIKFLSTIDGRIGYYGETEETIDHYCNQLVDSLHIYLIMCPVKGKHIIPALVFNPGVTTQTNVYVGVAVVPMVGVTVLPWPIIPLSTIGDIGYEVYDGAGGGFSIDEDWITKQSPKIDIWNDTVFKNHKDIYVIDIVGEVEQVVVAAGVRG